MTQRGRRKCREALCDRLCAEWGLDPERYRYVDRNRVFRVSPAVACSRLGVAWRGVEGARRTSEGAERRRLRSRSTFRGGFLLDWPAREQPWGRASWSPWAPAWGCAGAQRADLTAVIAPASHPSLGAAGMSASPSALPSGPRISYPQDSAASPI